MDDRHRQAEWRKAFPPPPKPPRVRAQRNAGRRQRTPAWADLEAIRCVYAECVLTNRRTGIKHHVDHVLPLFGEKVSGLHVAENLQTIPATENLAKFNRFEP